MENSLPQGWEFPLLGEVVNITSGNSSLTKKVYKEDGKYIAFSGTGPDGKVDFFEEEGEAIILSAVGARCGKCFRANGQWTTIANTSVIRAFANDDKHVDYLFYLLNNENFWPKGGSGQPFVQTGKAQKEIHIPLPPLDEQHRIVAKLDAVMQKVESNKQRLEKIPIILKRFRQSVLAAAVSGKLTEEWKKKNGFKEWDEVELNSVIPKGGIFDGPFGSNLKTADYTDKGIRVIRLENIEHLYFVHEKETYITKEKYQSLLRHTVGEGDIIFSSFISEEIRACILPYLPTKAIAKADCFCIRPDENKIDKFFLLFVLTSMRSFEQLVLNIHGATRPRINTTQLKTLSIPLPEVVEQKEIVRKVEQLFAFADKLEARYTKAKAMLDKLPQSILAKAFRGELVAQNPEDEPASVLLEKIKAEKETLRQAQGKKGGKKTKAYSIEEKPMKIAAEKKVKYKKVKA
ncbi:MAG: restriction endonuclease subunit S [Bacteroidia bacterium]